MCVRVCVWKAFRLPSTSPRLPPQSPYTHTETRTHFPNTHTHPPALLPLRVKLSPDEKNPFHKSDQYSPKGHHMNSTPTPVILQSIVYFRYRVVFKPKIRVLYNLERNHKRVDLWTKDDRYLKKKGAFIFEVALVQRTSHCLQQFCNKVKSQGISETVNPDVQRPAKQERQARPRRGQPGVCCLHAGGGGGRQGCSLQ